jgi:hypothetical protein
MAQPEKLNLWDRIFNRKRQEIVSEGQETWDYHCGGVEIGAPFIRYFVKYKIINRVTGSETIEKVYLN